MPELPEVETLRRQLEAAVRGRTIADVWIDPGTDRLVQGMPVRAFVDGLRGRRLEAFERRGKFLIIRLDRDLTWLAHRRMSGNFILANGGDADQAFLRARFTLDDGRELRWVDLRKFGTMWLTDEPETVLAGLGPEPLDGAFTVDGLRASLARRAAPVKAVLLDQAVVAGLGNLYADEALHYARIHPKRPAKSLSKAEVARLRDGISRALEQGLANLGSSIGAAPGKEMSLRDHVNLDGEPGSNQEHIVAYGREGEPCLTCGTPIERIKLAQRSAHFCPKCQRLPRASAGRTGRRA
jgi:formamidopyrimidine-DNA glycosylase